jgi:hypothetical protein
MRVVVCILRTLAVVSTFALCCAAGDKASNPNKPADSPIYVVANQDLGFPQPNVVSFYQVQGTQLTFTLGLNIVGNGIQGGFFGTSRLTSIPSVSAPCLYASNSGSNDIAAISLQTQQLVGNFLASDGDDGSGDGIGLAVNSNFLYAAFTASNTIATFAQQPGCGLTFVADIPAVGLQGGSVAGMAVNASTLVVAYGDGSVQSFNVAGGVPVPNNDLQNTNGYGGAAIIAPRTTGNMPSSVEITRDGRFAIFGDISAATTVEVASLASGTLGRTTVYTVGTGVDAGTIRLSPDESLLYIANSESGSVTAAFFNATTGQITPGCTSGPLRGFNVRPWLGAVATRDTTGTGNVLFVAEFGRDFEEINHGPSSALGILTITSNGHTCTLTEADNSPVLLSSPGVLSIGVYPPRPF